MKKIENQREGTHTDTTRNAGMNKHNQLKTDYPLSEKDEVKQAESNIRKTRRKLL